MNSVLADINVVPGTTGCFVCDEDGRILARELPTIYDDAMLTQAGHLAGWIGEGLRTSEAMSKIDLVFAEGRIVIVFLEGGAYLCVLCIPEINSSLLTMTLNVAVRKLHPSVTKAMQAPDPDDLRQRQLQALVRLELGEHAEKALEMLTVAGNDSKELERACERIAKMTRLFVDKKKSKELADSMAAVLKG